jgi:hypothetical protein
MDAFYCRCACMWDWRLFRDLFHPKVSCTCSIFISLIHIVVELDDLAKEDGGYLFIGIAAVGLALNILGTIVFAGG